MSPDPARSEQVVEEYKKHKLAASAVHRIRALLKRFEQERIIDMRLAWIGIGLVAALVLVWLVFILGAERVTL